MSMPIQRRLRRWATAIAVPHPQKGSRTVSPSLELALMMRSRRASGSSQAFAALGAAACGSE